MPTEIDSFRPEICPKQLASDTLTSCWFERLLHGDGLLLGLEVVEENGSLGGVLAPVANDDARAVDDLAGITLAVERACRSRSAKSSTHTALSISQSL